MLRPISASVLTCDWIRSGAATDTGKYGFDKRNMRCDDNLIDTRDVDNVCGLRCRTAKVNAPWSSFSELIWRIGRRWVAQATECADMSHIWLNSFEPGMRCFISSALYRNERINLGCIAHSVPLETRREVRPHQLGNGGLKQCPPHPFSAAILLRVVRRTGGDGSTQLMTSQHLLHWCIGLAKLGRVIRCATGGL